MAVGEGIVRGVGAGAGAYIEERFRGRGRTTAEIKGNKRKEKYEAKSSTQYRKAKTKQKQEYYDTAFEENVNVLDRRFATSRERAKLLSEAKERNRLSEVKKRQQEAYDRSYGSNMGKNAADWAKSHIDGSAPDSDYNRSKSYPKLLSGSSSYSVTRNTYKPPESNTVIYVDPKGNARKKRPGGKHN